jgi:hypothetical protein
MTFAKIVNMVTRGPTPTDDGLPTRVLQDGRPDQGEWDGA